MRLRIFTDSAPCWANQTPKLCLDSLLHKSIYFSFHINAFIRWNFYLVIFILILAASLVTQLSRGLSSAFFPLKNVSNYLCLWEQWEQQCTKDKNIWNYRQENYREATAVVRVPTNYPFTDLLLELLEWTTQQRNNLKDPFGYHPTENVSWAHLLRNSVHVDQLLKTLIQ